MAGFPRSVTRLIDQLERLPGIGPKSAQRLALWLLRQPPERVRALADSLSLATEEVGLCPRCGYFTEATRCALCDDPRRDETALCVVGDARDLLAIEGTGSFQGRYHVLGGLISPADGVGPTDLNTDGLRQRLADGTVHEVILALNPTPEGDMTAAYLVRLLRAEGRRITRPATGLPAGGDLNYADRSTLAQAMAGRREL